MAMKQIIKKVLMALSKTPFGPVLCFAWNALACIQMQWFHLLWHLQGAKMPTEEEQERMREYVTFLFKSFERQKLAKRLYRNIQRYYPGVRVIIVDDSSTPLDLVGPGLQVVQLPFNSGLSVGLNRGLALVETPFVVRMDDDELLTPHSNFHRQLDFLLSHPEIHLAGILPMNLPLKRNWKDREVTMYKSFAMSRAPQKLLIPHGTRIDEHHVVLGKVPNIFLARTDSYRSIGYDDQIRMIDHHEFFFRAAGNLVSVLDESCFVLHNHCMFDNGYNKYRLDIMADKRYIAVKHAAYNYFGKKQSQ